jgi:hypothetical protein
MAGALMDEAEASGRKRPTASDRFRLFLGGMREQLIAPSRSSGLSLAALIGGFAFSTFYLAVITWAPGVRFAGAIGPFTNPAIVTCVLLSVALTFAVLGRAGGARVFALLAVTSAVVIGVLAIALHWMGPGPNATAILVAIGLLGASQVRGALNAVLLVASTALVIVAIVVGEFAILGGAYLSPVTMIELAVSGAALLAAVALMLVVLVSPRTGLAKPPRTR